MTFDSIPDHAFARGRICIIRMSGGIPVVLAFTTQHDHKEFNGCFCVL